MVVANETREKSLSDKETQKTFDKEVQKLLADYSSLESKMKQLKKDLRTLQDKNGEDKSYGQETLEAEELKLLQMEQHYWDAKKFLKHTASFLTRFMSPQTLKLLRV